MASAAKALRFERSSDPEETATRKARRGPSRSHSLLLSFSSSSHSALCISSSSFFSTSLLSDSWSYSSLSHLRCSLEPYFKNSFVLSLSCSLFVCASSSSASPAARKTRLRGERPGIRINLVCVSACVSAQAETKSRYDDMVINKDINVRNNNRRIN